MTVALWGLVGLAVLVLIHVSADSFLLKGSVGNAWTIGPRDSGPTPGVLSGRAGRALRNLLETAPAFLALAVVAHLSGRMGWAVQWGIWLYLGGRLVYLPGYLSGVPWLRTIIWQVATAGIALMLFGVLVP